MFGGFLQRGQGCEFCGTGTCLHSDGMFMRRLVVGCSECMGYEFVGKCESELLCIVRSRHAMIPRD